LRIRYFHKDSFLYMTEAVYHGVKYNDIERDTLFFAEGFGMHKNPYFNNPCHLMAQGELLIIEPRTRFRLVILVFLFTVRKQV
jgi:hypothetical protein